VTDNIFSPDQGKPNQSIPEGTAPADVRVVAENEAINKEDKPKSSSENAETPAKPSILWRIVTTPRRWWDALKDNANTNRAIAAATIVIAVATGLTWWEAHSGGRQTDKIIAADDRIAKAMEDSIGQAQQTFATTTRQAEIAQRAWISAMVFPKDMQHYSAGKLFDVQISITNSGRTPAMGVSHAMRVTTVLKTSTNVGMLLRKPVFDDQDFIPDGNIQPNASVHADTLFNLMPDIVSKIETSQLRMYVYGMINYSDVFKTPHWMTFCTFLLSGGEFANCSQYNDVDENLPPKSSTQPN
jgi:hypothetical protein